MSEWLDDNGTRHWIDDEGREHVELIATQTFKFPTVQFDFNTGE
ncbi:hypothetical protein [Gordonia sp. UCD-TK1]|nr:hypothetical protein [Gordonia sp. UCD-TK1]